MEIYKCLAELLPESCDDFLTTYTTYIKTDASLIAAKTAGTKR